MLISGGARASSGRELERKEFQYGEVSHILHLIQKEKGLFPNSSPTILQIQLGLASHRQAARDEACQQAKDLVLKFLSDELASIQRDVPEHTAAHAHITEFIAEVTPDIRALKQYNMWSEGTEITRKIIAFIKEHKLQLAHAHGETPLPNTHDLAAERRQLQPTISAAAATASPPNLRNPNDLVTLKKSVAFVLERLDTVASSLAQEVQSHKTALQAQTPTEQFEALKTTFAFLDQHDPGLTAALAAYRSTD